jgi:aquaporin Z
MSDTEPATIPLSQKIAAEALGTFVLVFFGAGAAVVSGGDYVATGLAFGLAILVMVYAVGHISGGHFNPAVSVGAALSGRIAWSQVVIYVGAQLAGALVGGLALFTLLHGIPDFEASGHMGQNFFGDKRPGGGEYAVWAAFLLELLATAVFVSVILAVTDLRNPNPAAAPAVIGLSLTLIHFATINLTGTSVNPARSIGVGVFAGSDAVVQLWLFILAPLAGAAVAGLTYPLVFGRDRDPVEGSGLNFSRPAPAAGYAGAWDANAQYQQQSWDPSTQQWGQSGQQQQWGQTGQQQQWETQYPGWRWDAATQQWMPDEQQQWQQPETPGAQAPGAEGGEDPRTQIRPPDGPA